MSSSRYEPPFPRSLLVHGRHVSIERVKHLSLSCMHDVAVRSVSYVLVTHRIGSRTTSACRTMGLAYMPNKGVRRHGVSCGIQGGCPWYP